MVSLFAAAALTGEVAVIERMPEQIEQVASWAMSLVWLAATGLVIRLARPRAATAPRPPARTEPMAAAVAEDERRPSERMRAAWFMARAGIDTDLVARVAQVPYVFAELIVLDARADSGSEPR